MVKAILLVMVSVGVVVLMVSDGSGGSDGCDGDCRWGSGDGSDGGRGGNS